MLQLPAHIPPDQLIETRAYHIWRGEDGIIRVRYKVDPIVEISDIQQQFELIISLNGGEQALVLGDFSNLKRISADYHTRRYATGDYAQQVFKASAIVGASGLTRTLGNIFIRMSRPKYPIKIFGDEASAVDWLHHQHA